MLFDLTDKLVWVAGQHGMVGGAMMRRLERERCCLLRDPGRAAVDLRRQSEVEDWMASHRPQIVFLTAGRVGGLYANDAFPADFLYDNLLIEANIIHAAYRTGVEKLLFFGSSCIYPREAPQPIPEEALLTGPLEPTNEGYAIAKIATLELGKMYRRQFSMNVISLMPTNLYGPGDNFHPVNSHALAALLRKIHEAKVTGSSTVDVWGTGTPRREFLHVDDLADAAVFAAESYEAEGHLNIGTGRDITIRELAELIADVVGWDGELVFNKDMPDGAPRKLLDVSRIEALGWKARVSLREGLEQTYRWYVNSLP